MTIIANPGTSAMTAAYKADRAPYHYMDKISSFSFGAGGTYFATCQESSNDYN
eukprot:CAMPEP_0118946232 /NCGR_PEP_ID=MMETSP1169-20130426/43860_1 /TAXON_ID=36882 /ORGANISM="Pyramimonas obovata, Strain CCMP722" /LENGTH=52 /DNA_ID=CAMNT_0006892151 /DNA_START=17 /DNA_END=172 /DNA_ORIENTATION=-